MAPTRTECRKSPGQFSDAITQAGKRKKDRYTVLSPALLDMLDRYCWAARPEDLLFTTRSTGRPITVSTVQRVCKQAQQNSIVPDGMLNLILDH